MREIKFRAWDKNKQEMISGFMVESDTGKCYTGWQNSIELEDLILMQYTGLKDKNGREIYEGDIVKCWPRNGSFKAVELVEWDNCGFHPYSDCRLNCGCCASGLRGGETEVVGNVYENPELLGGGVG